MVVPSRRSGNASTTSRAVQCYRRSNDPVPFGRILLKQVDGDLIALGPAVKSGRHLPACGTFLINLDIQRRSVGACKHQSVVNQQALSNGRRGRPLQRTGATEPCRTRVNKRNSVLSHKRRKVRPGSREDARLVTAETILDSRLEGWIRDPSEKARLDSESTLVHTTHAHLVWLAAR